MVEDSFPWLDDHTKAAIRDLYWNVVYNEIDAIFVITGRERFGKSMLSMIIWAYLDHLRKEWGLQPTIDLEKKMAYVPEDYAKNIDKSDGMPGDVVSYDEAGTGMYNRESMSRSNIDLNKILMTCGYKNLVHLLTLPNFFALDKEVRARRVAALFVVSAHPRQLKVKCVNGSSYDVTKLEKGWFRSYSAEEVQAIWKDSRTSHVHYPPTPHGDQRFKSIVGEPLWVAYQTHSNKQKRTYISRVAGGLAYAGRKRKKVEDTAVLNEFDESPNLTDEELEVIEGGSI
jgi:hypothetical protein